jgi:hypothetical protein
MTIVRSAVGVALFLAVMFGIRWGADALVRKAIRQSQDSKITWGGSHDFAKPAIDWNDSKLQMPQDWQKTYLYPPSNDDSGPKYRVR